MSTDSFEQLGKIDDLNLTLSDCECFWTQTLEIYIEALLNRIGVIGLLGKLSFHYSIS